jgi:hypothetical protein
MKIKNALKPFGLFIAASGLIIAGCNKEVNLESATPEESVTLTELTVDDAAADEIFTEIHEQELGVLDDIGMPDIGLNNETEINQDSVGNRCFTVTITPRELTAFPKTVIINYGNGCKGRDGKTRKGKIITVYSAPMVRPEATAVTRFDGFYVNDIKVEGKHTTKNNSTSDVRIFTRTVEGGKLTFPGGGVIVWNATHTNKQVAGLGTPGFPFDDAFEITGRAKGVSEKNGKRVEWSRTIVEPLFKAFRCRWISKGVVHITRNDKKAILNFGDGTCDNKAILIINGERKEITL